MASDRDIERLRELIALTGERRWQYKPGVCEVNTAEALAELAEALLGERDDAIARAESAEAEPAAERERSRRLVEDLRQMADRWEESRGAWTPSPSPFAMEVRAALSEYEGGQIDVE